MTHITTLQLLNYQIDISKQFSYKDINISKLEQEVTEVLSENPDTKILLCEMIERYAFSPEEQNSLDRVFECLEKLTPNYFLVTDDTMGHEASFKGNVAYLPGCMLLAYYHIWIKGHPTATEWNSNDGKGLMFLGKCEKMHRIGLLRKFYEQGALGTVEWTANFANQRGLIKDKFFADYSDSEFDTFFNACNRTLDLPNDHPAHPADDTHSFQHQGFPFDHTLYERTAFSVILESEYYSKDIPGISEKSWRAIANKHPFIMVGGESNIPELKKMGFRTFEEYLVIPEYCSILTDTRDMNKALDSVITNTVEFSKLLKDPSPALVAKIREDVDHNFNLFESFMEDKVGKFLKTTGLDITAISRMLEPHLSYWCL